MGTGKKHPGINFEVQLIWMWRKHHGPTSDLNTTSDLKLRTVEWKMCERCKGDLLGGFFLTATVTLPNHPISHGSNDGFSCYKDVISNSFILISAKHTIEKSHHTNIDMDTFLEPCILFSLYIPPNVIFQRKTNRELRHRKPITFGHPTEPGLHGSSSR